MTEQAFLNKVLLSFSYPVKAFRCWIISSLIVWLPSIHLLAGPTLKQDAGTVIVELKKTAEQRLNFSSNLLQELLRDLDSAPRVFDKVLAKGEALKNQHKSEDTLSKEVNECRAVLVRRKKDLEKLLVSSCFGVSASRNISKIGDLEKELDDVQAISSTVIIRLEADLKKVSEWQTLYKESVSEMGRQKTLEMLRGFIERATVRDRNKSGNSQ